MNTLERFYEKFDEDKRLKRRHGEVEFFVTNFYIHQLLNDIQNPKIADIGAGTGAYAVPLANEGYDITAVEFTKQNLQKLRAKHSGVKTFLGDAKNLSMLPSDTFDLTLLFGPMYHLLSKQEKMQALLEAKRITKPNGIIMVAYYMNDYAVLCHGFLDGNIKQSLQEKRLDKNFKIISKKDDIFSFDRLSDINGYKQKAKLKRLFMFAPDGASDYIRTELNNMDTETFETYKKYQLAVSKNKELFGASSHLVDVLKKENL